MRTTTPTLKVQSFDVRMLLWCVVDGFIIWKNINFSYFPQYSNPLHDGAEAAHRLNEPLSLTRPNTSAICNKKRRIVPFRFKWISPCFQDWRNTDLVCSRQWQLKVWHPMFRVVVKVPISGHWASLCLGQCCGSQAIIPVGLKNKKLSNLISFLSQWV